MLLLNLLNDFLLHQNVGKVKRARYSPFQHAVSQHTEVLLIAPKCKKSQTRKLFTFSACCFSTYWGARMLLVRPPTTITLMCTIIALYFITMTNLLSTTLKICMYVQNQKNTWLGSGLAAACHSLGPFSKWGHLIFRFDICLLVSSLRFVPYPGGRLTGQVYPPTITKRSQCVVKPTIEKQASLLRFMFMNNAVHPLSQNMGILKAVMFHSMKFIFIEKPMIHYLHHSQQLCALM